MTSPFYSGRTFATNSTNTPTINIGGTSRPIGKIFMNDANFDEIGIRITPPNLVFSSGQSSRWFGSGILNKPIGDFFDSDDGGNLFQAVSSGDQTSQIPYFTRWINTEVHSRVIPEPSSFALAALFLAMFIVFLKSAYEKRNGK